MLSQMLSTKYQRNRCSSTAEEIICLFAPYDILEFQIMTILAILFPQPMNASYEFWFKSAQLCRRSRMKVLTDDRTDDGGGLSYKLHWFRGAKRHGCEPKHLELIISSRYFY